MDRSTSQRGTAGLICSSGTPGCAAVKLNETASRESCTKQKKELAEKLVLWLGAEVGPQLLLCVFVQCTRGGTLFGLTQLFPLRQLNVGTEAVIRREQAAAAAGCSRSVARGERCGSGARRWWAALSPEQRKPLAESPCGQDELGQKGVQGLSANG